MNTYRVRELRSTDAQALLAFETDNRQWFESHIDARDPAFYSLQGVTEHIQGYLSDFADGRWHPFVVEETGGKIVGRANLKSIDPVQRTAQIGYRIAQDACGQGLATLAVRHLIQEARRRWQLSQLVAYVYEANLGSKKVLARCGFLLEHPAAGAQAGGESRFVLAI